MRLHPFSSRRAGTVMLAVLVTASMNLVSKAQSSSQPPSQGLTPNKSVVGATAGAARAPEKYALAPGSHLKRSVTDPGVITTGQAITPAGVQAVFDEGEHAYSVAFGANGELWALSGKRLVSVDWRTNRVIFDHPMPLVDGYRGIAIDGARKRVAMTHVDPSNSNTFSISAGAARLSIADDAGGMKEIGGVLGENAVGTPTWNGDNVLVPLLFNDKLAVVNVLDGRVNDIGVGIAPIAVASSGNSAYVANWGGHPPSPTELSAPTGRETHADRVRIDDEGIAKAGSVSVVDLAKNEVKATIEVGRHPTALALDATRRRLFVANTNDDTISVIDLDSLRVSKTLPIRPFAVDVYGLAPTALALDAEKQRLYIALGGVNVIAIYDLTGDRVLGLIPTGWYPAALDLDVSRGQLAIATLLGVGAGSFTPELIDWLQFPADMVRFSGAGSPVAGVDTRYVHAVRGTVHVVSLPDEAQLARYTKAVAENVHLRLRATGPVERTIHAAPKPVPSRSGDPSLIDHVVYIVKENQSYDVLFGDLPLGNGAPNMVMYNDDVIPNHRELAKDYVLLDNFYASGTMSQDGHQWLTQANETSYTQRPGDVGRSYPFDGTDPLAYSGHGFIWTATKAAGRSVAVFGEFAPSLTGESPSRIDLLKRWQSSEKFRGTWNTTSPIPSLNRVLVRDFPGCTLTVPDVIRAQQFIDTLRSYEAKKNMPNLTIIQLPSDHSYGTAPGRSSPKSMLADNDYALGMVVDALSKSSFWPKMAIYVVEDDAQSGVDHVDGHRTVALVVSPYTRRRSVDSTFYSHPSILKTIELQLGLRSMSLFDSIANDMRASFIDTPDFTPYTAIKPKQDLFEVNPALESLSGSRRQAAIESAAIDWNVLDSAPPAWISEVLWHEARGWSAPYPRPKNAMFGVPYSDSDDANE